MDFHELYNNYFTINIEITLNRFENNPVSKDVALFRASHRPLDFNIVLQEDFLKKKA